MIGLRIVAVLLTGFIFVPSAAHLFAMPTKMAFGRDAYFTVQAIYAGWALFAVPIAAALLANLVLWHRLRRSEPASARWALAAAALIALSLILFFLWVYPANRATENWTRIVDNWASLRHQWEYGHAVDAVVIMLAFVAATVAAVTRSPDKGRFD